MDSVLSDDADSRASGARCRSVATATLSVLLTWLEGAEAAFRHAQAAGDVAEQAALAGLMARLGEAAWVRIHKAWGLHVWNPTRCVD